MDAVSPVPVGNKPCLLHDINMPNSSTQRVPSGPSITQRHPTSVHAQREIPRYGATKWRSAHTQRDGAEETHTPRYIVGRAMLDHSQELQGSALGANDNNGGRQGVQSAVMNRIGLQLPWSTNCPIDHHRTDRHGCPTQHNFPGVDALDVHARRQLHAASVTSSRRNSDGLCL